MARSAAERRLIRILSDEDYGPKLAQLSVDDSNYVLRLIDQNKGKEARQAIERLHQERLARRRTSKPEPKQPTVTVTRRERERRAIANILSKAEGRAERKRVQAHVKYMSIDELDFAADATLEDLSDRAQQDPYLTTDTGDDLNPFWYH